MVRCTRHCCIGQHEQWNTTAVSCFSQPVHMVRYSCQKKSKHKEHWFLFVSIQQRTIFSVCFRSTKCNFSRYLPFIKTIFRVRFHSTKNSLSHLFPFNKEQWFALVCIQQGTMVRVNCYSTRNNGSR